MRWKRALLLLAGICILSAVVLSGYVYYAPFSIMPPQNKPDQAPQKVYDYYMIIDEASGTTLMYIPLVAHVGDEVLSEDNKLYEIVRIEENRAYARFVRDINIEKYKE